MVGPKRSSPVLPYTCKIELQLMYALVFISMAVFCIHSAQLIDDASFAWAAIYLLLDSRCLSVVSFCGPAGSQDCSAAAIAVGSHRREGAIAASRTDPAYYYSYCPSLLAAIDELNRSE